MKLSYLTCSLWFGLISVATLSLVAAVLWWFSTYIVGPPYLFNQYTILFGLLVALLIPVYGAGTNFVKYEKRRMRIDEILLLAPLFGAIAGLVAYGVVIVAGLLDDPNIPDHPFAMHELVSFGLATILYATIILFIPFGLALWTISLLAKSSNNAPNDAQSD